MAEFKVGDRVAVYGAESSGTYTHCFDGERGEIVRINPYVTNPLVVEMDLHWSKECFFHPRQCKRLIRKERRRVWVRFYNFIEGIDKASETPLDPISGCSVVEFIEVRRKK